MRIFFAIILVLLTAVGYLNYRVDPFNNFHPKFIALQKQLEHDQAIVFSGDMDERLQKQAQIKLLKDVDVLSLGSSRSFHVYSELFKPEVKLFNGAVSAAIFEDYIAVWQLTKQQGLHPKKVILFVDLWQFNQNYNYSKPSWKSLKEEIYTFLRMEHHGGLENTGAITTFDSWSEGFNSLVEMLSWNTLEESLKNIDDNDWKYAHRFQEIRKIENMEDEHGIRWDGSHITRKSELAPKTEEQLDHIAHKSAIGKANSEMNVYHQDPEAAHRLEMLLDDMQASGAEVQIIIPPINPWVLKVVKNEIHTFSIYEAEIQELKKIIQHRPKIQFCDSKTVSDAGCEDHDFIDSLHINPACTTKILHHCLKAPQWSALLNK